MGLRKEGQAIKINKNRIVSFHRISIVVIVVFIALLFLGIHNNASILANERIATLHPSISSDQISTSEHGYVSTFQTATTDFYFAESGLLYAGSSGGTNYESTLVNDDTFQQLDSQDFETLTANERSITTGYEGGFSYLETAACDGISDEIYPHRDYVAKNVSDESVIYGTTDGVAGAQFFDDELYENISEENLVAGGEGWPFGQGPDDNTGESLVYLWIEDGEYYKVRDRKTMHIDTWYTGNIRGQMENVTIWATYRVKDNDYDGATSIEFRKSGGSYYATTITPQSHETSYVTKNYTITEINFNSVNEIQNLEVKFYNNGDEEVRFDRLWLTITVFGAEYMLNIEQDIASVPPADFYELWIYGNYTSEVGSDPINIEVKNSTGKWETLGTFHCVTSRGWNVYPLNKSKHLLGAEQDSITIRYRDTTPDTDTSSISIDIVEVRAYSESSYNLDLYYTFIWSGNEPDLVTISVWDRSVSNQNLNASILNWDDPNPSTQWVHLFELVGSYTNHSYISSDNPGRFINDTTGEIRIRYSEVDSPDSSLLRVDYLGVNIHLSTGPNSQQINMVYDIENFQGDRSKVTQIRVLDSSYVNDSAVEVDVQLFDYTNIQWVTCFSINETIETSHSATLSSSPGNFISSNPGNILIRYKFNDAAPITLSVDYLRVEITYTGDDDGSNGSGGTGDGGESGGDGGGGGGDGTSLNTLSMSVVYPDQIEKYSEAQIDVFLTNDEGKFISDANVTLTIGKDTKSIYMEEKDEYYTLILKTDELDTGNHTFRVSASKLGFKDIVSSAFPFRVVVSYPFLTLFQHPSYSSEVIKNPVILLLDPTFYFLPSLVVFGFILTNTIFAPIDPKKLRSIYIFTPEGQGIYYRTFGKEGIDSQLTTAALSGIINLIMEATSSKKPTNTIDQETFDIFLEYGRIVTIATFIEKRTLNKRKIRKGQKKLVEKVEEKYEHIIVDWDGNLSYFFEIDQFVFDVFDFKVTKDLSKLIFDVAHIQEELATLYAAQEKFHLCGKALWNAYDLYSRIKSPRAPFVLESWKALEKGYLLDYLASNNILGSKIISKFFAILDFLKTPKLLKVLYKLRYIIYPEISKELYYLIPPEKLTERTDEVI